MKMRLRNKLHSFPSSGKNFLFLALAALLCFGCSDGEASMPNILIFTVDDMDITSVNAYGNPLPGLTPNMDRLAAQGMRFTNAHVSSAICMPCRQSMMTGLHPHQNGSMGFIEVEEGACPSLSGLLMEHGYYTASYGKGRDFNAFPWDDFVSWYGGTEGWHSRKPECYYQSTKKAIRTAKEQGKPFFIGVHTTDPHRPFAGSEQENEWVAEINKRDGGDAGPYPEVNQFCTPEQVPLLPYLPDLPDIRKETMQYLTAVHRGDSTLGRILDLLEEEGVDGETLLIFLSDHGAAMPTAKHNCYRHGSVTPLMVRWPGKIEEGSVDREHMISTLDIMPTILEVLNIPEPEIQDGRSMLSILKGGKQEGRDHVYTTYNYIFPGIQVFPMRGIHTREWSYVFNPWSDGNKKRLQENGQPTENQSGLTFAAIQEAALTDPAMEERLDYILHRRRNELFDLNADPYSFQNLAEKHEYEEQLGEMQELMRQEMARTNDPLLESLEKGTSYPESWSVREK